MFRNLRLPSAPRLFIPGLKPVALRRLHVFHGMSSHLDKNGRLLWVEDGYTDNLLHDEGEQFMLSAAFDTDLAGYGAPPANLYLGLDNRASLAEGDTLASLTGEPASGGYARAAVSTTTGFTLTQPGAYYQAATATISFTASGASWGTLNHRFLTTASSGTAGKLIASLSFGTSRSVSDGDTLNSSLILGLSE